MSSSEVNEQITDATTEEKKVERNWQGSPFNDQLLKVVLTINIILLIAVPALFIYNGIQDSRLEVLLGNAESKAIHIPLHIWAVWFCITAVIFCGELFYSRYSEEEIDSSKWGFAANLEDEDEEDPEDVAAEAAPDEESEEDKSGD